MLLRALEKRPNFPDVFNLLGVLSDRSQLFDESERYFKRALELSPDHAAASFNLGLSALSGVGGNVEDPVIERALNLIYQNINRFYNFRGLHSFKEKFHPTWSPRYLVYPNPSNLPAISAALMRANLGGGILSLLRRN